MAAQQLVEAEYYLDTDPGIGMGTPLAVLDGDSVDLTFNLLTDSMSLGIHTVVIRVKSDSNIWLHYAFSDIDVTQRKTYDLETAEYYIDDDPGPGNGQPIATNVDSLQDQILNIASDTLSPGQHTVVVRTMDVNGFWSIFTRKNFVVKEKVEGPPLTIAEYAIGTDPGINSAVQFSVSHPDTTTEVLTIPTDTFSVGWHPLFVRVMDRSGHWTSTLSDSFRVEDCQIPGLVAFGFEAACDTSLMLSDSTSILSGIADSNLTFAWDLYNDGTIDSGAPSFEFMPGLPIASIEVKLVVTEADGFCRDSAVATISIPYPTLDTLTSEQICEGDTILIFGKAQTTAGIFTNNLTTVEGCDSVLVKELIVNDQPGIPDVQADSHSQDYLFTSAEAVTYQWYYNNNPIAGATDDTVSFQGSGSYYVEITDSNGCEAVSNVFVISGIDHLGNAQVKLSVFPNPTSSGRITLKHDGLQGEIIEIRDLHGRLIAPPFQIRNDQMPVNLTEAPKGLYMITVRGKPFISQPLVIQ